MFKIKSIIIGLFVMLFACTIADTVLAAPISWQNEPLSHHSGLLTADYTWGSSWNYQTNPNDGILWDTELATLISTNITSYQNIQIVMGQCFSGGFINDLQRPNTAIMTSSNWDIPAHYYPSSGNSFLHSWEAAVGSNKQTSMNEAFIAGSSVFSYLDNPQYYYSDPDLRDSTLHSGTSSDHAILFMAGWKPGDLAEYTVLWNDLNYMHSTLIDYGYADDDIHVLFANGKDFWGNPLPNWVDMNATESNLSNVFMSLSTSFTGNAGLEESLFLWTFDHGVQTDQDPPPVFPSIPEPTTVLLFGFGLIGLACVAKKEFASSNG